MSTSKQCTYITHDHSKPEDHMGSGFITCNIGYPLKSWEWEEVKEGKTSGVTDNKERYTGTLR